MAFLYIFCHKKQKYYVSAGSRTLLGLFPLVLKSLSGHNAVRSFIPDLVLIDRVDPVISFSER